MALLSELSDEIARSISAVLPSIVEIQVWKSRSSLNPMRLLDGEEFEAAAGAGVVIRPDGVIITNHHVVEGSTRVTIRLHDGRRFEADVRGVDPVSDIAVLCLPTTGLPVAPLGVERPTRLGEVVLAVGHPFGLTSTVTIGIVSAAARFSMAPSARLPSVYIQTDAAINPGNSGGALVGCDGSVLGINTWGVNAAEGQGLAFAVPTTVAVKVASRLLEGGSPAYGTLGVSGIEGELPAQVVAKHALKQATALWVTEIEGEGPAKKAGIRAGDWILRVGDERVDSLEAFLEILRGDLVGTLVTVQILRGADFAVAERRMEIAKLSPPKA